MEKERKEKKSISWKPLNVKIKIAEEGGSIAVEELNGQWIESCPRSFRHKEGS